MRKNNSIYDEAYLEASRKSLEVLHQRIIQSDENILRLLSKLAQCLKDEANE